jgi:flagellar hook assembly protein FlgD
MDTKQNTVFTSNSVDFKWNGLNLAGEPVSQGNYIYIIVAKDDAGNVINKYKQLHLQR